MVGSSKNRALEGSKIEVLRIWKADRSLSILGIISYILKLKPDMVHFNVHFQSYGKSRLTNFIGLSLIFFCRLLGLKIVVAAHNFGDKVDLDKVQVKSNLVNRLGIFVATKLILSASRLAVTVRSYVTYLKKRYRYGRASYIPHGASVIKCPSHSHPERIVLIFGHMGPYKGLPILLKTFEEIVKERSDVKLVIAGASHPNFPGYLESLRKNVISKVDFLGYVREEDLMKVFGAADVVVLPYLTATGTSGAFHIACSYGKPVVASDLPEIRELVSEGAAALLVPPSDVSALKKGILRVLDDEGLAARMSEQNLAFARGESWRTVAKAFEQVYVDLINS